MSKAANRDKDSKGRGPGRPFAPGTSGNPGGRPAKTDDDRAVEAYLRERSLANVKAAEECAAKARDAGDFKTAGHIYLSLAKLVVGEQVRMDANVRDTTERPPSPLSDASALEIAAVLDELRSRDAARVG